jgi:hypothetical protein
MDFAISWGGDPEDVTVTTRGEASVEALDAMTQAIVGDARFRDGLAILVDHSATHWAQLTASDARRRVALLELQAEQIGHQRIAFVVSSAADFGVGRMLTLLAEGRADIDGRVFFTADDARAWLRQR